MGFRPIFLTIVGLMDVCEPRGGDFGFLLNIRICFQKMCESCANGSIIRMNLWKEATAGVTHVIGVDKRRREGLS